MNEHYVMLIEFATDRGKPVVMHTGKGPVVSTRENQYLLEEIASALMSDNLIVGYQIARLESRVVRRGDAPLFEKNI